MTERTRLAILQILVAYFAGAITMLLFLTPGKVSLNDLLDRENALTWLDFDQAADKVEEFCNWVLVRLGQDKQDLQGKSRNH